MSRPARHPAREAALSERAPRARARLLLQGELADTLDLGDGGEDAVPLGGGQLDGAFGPGTLEGGVDDPALGGRLTELDVDVVGEVLAADVERGVAFRGAAALAGTGDDAAVGIGTGTAHAAVALDGAAPGIDELAVSGFVGETGLQVGHVLEGAMRP